MLFVFRGTPELGKEFFDHFWPEAKGIADPTGDLFRSFGLFRASWWRLLGPMVVLAAIRALWNGHRNGSPAPDTMRNPGLYIIEKEAIVWEHNFHHIGDHPNFASLQKWGSKAL